jgi:adenosylcobinamide kinase/adenosylcobinamide-phosphate guanylyltransferase
MSSTLVLGGARSGKSAHAEALASASGREVVYIATAQPGRSDSEMAQRIAHHRAGRPPHWTTIEEPVALGAAILQWSAPSRVVLVDCLTLWLSNVLFSGADAFPETGVLTLPPLFHAQRQALLDAIANASGDVIFVSNEVGMGIVPMGAVSRAFVDEQGRLNQAVAAACGRAVFVAAGLPIILKDAPC